MITIDGEYRLEDLGLKVLDVFDDPVTTPFTENTIQVPRNDVTLLISEQSRPRPISISANSNTADHVEIEELLNNLSNMFYDSDGKRKKVTLELDHWQGKFVYAYIASEIQSDRKRNLTNVELNFICYDPNRYSKVFSDEVLWGSEIIDFTSHFKMGHDGVITNFDVAGNGDIRTNIYVDGLNVHPKIILNGSSDELKIISNGQTIDVPKFSNRKIEIDRFTSTNNGQEIFINARKFKLLQGNNVVTFQGNNKNFSVSFEFRDRYK